MRALHVVSSWPVGSAGVGVLTWTPGTGRPEVAAAGMTGDADLEYPWASVTKLCTALCVLVAVEEGTLALHDPAGPPGSTVAHLLAHASGLAPDAEVTLAPPARRRIYSNAGFEVLGRLVAGRAEMPFERYLAEAVTEPLGMTRARFGAGASPASGMEGTLEDLLRIAAELASPRLVDPSTLRGATRVAFPGLAGVLPGFGFQDPCDWGLGFEVKGTKSPHWTGRSTSPATFGHFGRSGAFLWVDPDAGVACAGLCDRAFGPWAATAWPALADAVLAEAANQKGAGA